MNDKLLKTLAAIWTVMAVMFGAAWTLYSRDFTSIAAEIKDIKIAHVEYTHRTDDRILRMHELLLERFREIDADRQARKSSGG